MLRGRSTPWWIAAALGLGALVWWPTAEPPPSMPRSASAAPAERPAIVDTLQPGETLSAVWEEHALDPRTLHDVAEAGEEVFSWRELRPGSVYRVFLGPDSLIRRLEVVANRDRTVDVRRVADTWEAELIETPLVRRTRSTSACIDVTLWDALTGSGEDPALAVMMAEVLAAQVDFYTDLRRGDCFDAVFRIDVRPDDSYRVVTVDAVRMRLANRSIEAYRFEGDEEQVGYYDQEGRSLKRRFLRSPLKYTRVSSGFGIRRHPILGRDREHPAIDYVAPAGTPVQAAGNGVVEFAGRNGGYGNHVRLKHGREYVTMYSHLSRIARGVTRGARVEQGQVIGYVGSTGLATGAHLDYRFIQRGRYVNPRAVNLPVGPPLEPHQMGAFASVRNALRYRLDAPLGHVVTPGGTRPAAR